MKTASKNRQTSVAPMNTEMSAPRTTTLRVENNEPKDSPAVRQAWVRLYETIVGKRRMAAQNGLAAQH
jgi:hypothetical protein